MFINEQWRKMRKNPFLVKYLSSIKNQYVSHSDKKRVTRIGGDVTLMITLLRRVVVAWPMFLACQIK
ncbi:hypothetical protein AU253_04175 [Yersinia pestis]|nr:hypothetical protein AU253_04175 [Yersinia pestis]